jgi:hypothetical protein
MHAAVPYRTVLLIMQHNLLLLLLLLLFAAALHCSHGGLQLCPQRQLWERRDLHRECATSNPTLKRQCIDAAAAPTRPW